METLKLTPYSVYLTVDLKKRLMECGQSRGASQTVRDALETFFSRQEPYNAGFNAGITEALAIVNRNSPQKILHELEGLKLS